MNMNSESSLRGAGVSPCSRRSWCWNGQHYDKTSTAWLANMDRHKAKIRPILAATYGAERDQIWWTRWRMFFMACAELFGYRGGEGWLVGHYRFESLSA